MHANKMICAQAYKEFGENIIKVEEMKTEQDFSSENLDINFVEVPLENHSNVITMPSRRTRRSVLKTSVSPKHDCSTDLKLIVKKDRFRPIRPKPAGSSLLRQKFEPPVNMGTLPTNRVLVSSTPGKEKIRYVMPTNVPNKTSNRTKPSSSKNIKNSNVIDSNINVVQSNTVNSDSSNTVNTLPRTDENKVRKTVRSKSSNTVANSNCSNNSNTNDNCNNNSNNNDEEMNTSKEISKSHRNSIELFFESMAQAVLNLPNEVQADIKMQICKIVTKAEIQYCESRAKSKTEK